MFLLHCLAVRFLQVNTEKVSVSRRKQNFAFFYEYVKDFRPSDNFDNPYLIIHWVANDNSEHFCELVSGTCFRVLGTLI